MGRPYASPTGAPLLTNTTLATDTFPANSPLVPPAAGRGLSGSRGAPPSSHPRRAWSVV